MSVLPARLFEALSDRYRIERELGAGGMATVYLAHDLKHDRKVALKVLKPELAAVLGAERFVVEIKTTASLSHPHILPLFDSGTADGFLYYVMPYVEGETLRAMLDRETQLAVDDAVRIAMNVADALDYAHRHGVVHRDIKPENILMHDGRPVVADFGIALAVSAAAGGRMTETGLSLGTPHYMSPEQATAEKELTGRSDIYSLASVLYEMLTGQPPHIGATAQQIIMKIIAEPAESVTKYRKSVPAHVAAAVGKALEKVPADRFSSAKAFAEALANPAFATGTIGAHAHARHDARGVSRRTFMLTAAAAALALIAAVWGWMRPAPPVEVSRFGIVLPDSQALSSGNASRLAVTRDGRTIVYVGEGTGGRRAQLYLRRWDQLAVEPIPGTEGAINPAFSPDGKKIAFVSGSPRALKVVTLGGGPAQALTDSLVDLGGVSWSTDGYIYYDAHLEGDGLARIREAGGKPEIASRPADENESWHSAPWALPNGNGVLFSISRARGTNPFDVGVLDTRTGTHRMLLRGVAARYAETGHLLYLTEGGALMAIRFDADRLTTSGDAVAITGGVAVRGLGRADVDISANGTLVYAAGVSSAREREFLWVSRTGAMTVIDSAWKKPILGSPALSPDGRSLAVGVEKGGGFEVWVKQLDRGPASKLADAGFGPAWSPDGRQIAFSASGGVRVGPADGSVLPEIRYPRRDPLTGLEYSPDGRWLIGTSAGDIYALRTSGDSAPVPLVNGPFLDRRGTISHDGRWLAYESDESGRSQVYVRPFPDVKRAKRQVSVDGGTLPRWSRDGRELFFLNESLEMVAVPVSLSPAFSMGVPQLLFKADFTSPPSAFAVHPDGKRFLMTRRVGSQRDVPDQLIVVQNFLEELRAKLPR